jgi:hypothetical protein
MTRFTLCLCLIVSSNFLVQRQVATLDLTNSLPQAREFEPVTGSSGGTGIGSGVAEFSYRAKQLFELTLMNIRMSKNGNDDRVVYEIELKNVSDEVVRIPWDPSPRDIEPAPPRPYEYELGSLGLELLGGSGENQPFESVSIYGSEESHTLQTLSPGECVSIRAETRVKTPSGSSAEEGHPSVVRATWNQYRVTVDGVPSRFHETLASEGTQIQSENTLAVPIAGSTEK